MSCNPWEFLYKNMLLNWDYASNNLTILSPPWHYNQAEHHSDTFKIATRKYIGWSSEILKKITKIELIIFIVYLWKYAIFGPIDEWKSIIANSPLITRCLHTFFYYFDELFLLMSSKSLQLKSLQTITLIFNFPHISSPDNLWVAPDGFCFQSKDRWC